MYRFRLALSTMISCYEKQPNALNYVPNHTPIHLVNIYLSNTYFMLGANLLLS